MNKSGITPAGYRVLVKPEKVEESYKGMIQLPDDVKDRKALMQQIGVLVAVGDTAWQHRDHGEVPWASIGDRVLFGKYAGVPLRGADGEKYRLLNDEDIAAIIDSEVEMNLE